MLSLDSYLFADSSTADIYKLGMAQNELMADRPVVLAGATSAFKDIAECFNTLHDKVKEAYKAKKGVKEKAPPSLKRLTEPRSRSAPAL